MVPGQVAQVDEWDASKDLAEIDWSVGTSASAGAIFSDGIWVYLAEASNVRALNRVDGSVAHSITGLAGSVTAIHSDGEYVFVAFSTFVRRYPVPDPVTGWAAHDWEFDHGASVRTVYSDGFAVFLGGDRDAGTPATHRRIDRATGDQVAPGNWSGDRGVGEEIHDIVSDGREVHVGGTNVGGISMIVGLGYDTGTGGSGSSSITDRVSALFITRDYILVAVDSGGGSVSLAKIQRDQSGALSATTEWDQDFQVPALDVTFDGRWIYLVGERALPDNSQLWVVSPETGRVVLTKDFGAGVTFLESCHCDGFGLFVAGVLSGGSNCHKLFIQPRTSQVRKFTGDERYRPAHYHHALIPTRWEGVF
jgi:hypothetical protein